MYFYRKCIFIRYNEHSKGYVFIGKHEHGIVTKLEVLRGWCPMCTQVW